MVLPAILCLSSAHRFSPRFSRVRFMNIATKEKQQIAHARPAKVKATKPSQVILPSSIILAACRSGIERKILTNANSNSGFKAVTFAVPSFRYFQTLKITADPIMTPTIPDKILATAIMLPSADVCMRSLLQRSCGRCRRQALPPHMLAAFSVDREPRR